MTPIPSEVPDKVRAFNNWIVEQTRDAVPVWEVGAQAGRQAREEGKSLLGPPRLSSRASVHTIEGPETPLKLRVIEPQDRPARGLFLHIHGGGWTWGGPHHHDPQMTALADSTGLITVSTSYRLAPEHPYPAGPDDCEAAALWLYHHGTEAFGQELVAIGGESAGGHLTAVTCLRLRDRHGLTPFRAALLTYGIYDLRGTPSMRAFGDQPLILNTSSTDWFVRLFAGDHNLADPDLSPIWADLQDMPPALFTAGTLDPLLDDTLFMAARWKAAGNQAQQDIWPGGVHAFDLYDNAYGRSARNRMHEFLNSTLRQT
ncbi:MAG: alpha/beta hydrolase [bacterium]|nr:alpha/beta hydrolase [bacterium]MCY3652032.1 alpha/beta hydrolase [bacterium]MDE0643738.1 alpha/beta hydrolase [bacterium]